MTQGIRDISGTYQGCKRHIRDISRMTLDIADTSGTYQGLVSYNMTLDTRDILGTY
jgi:hypothetical protein